MNKKRLLVGLVVALFVAIVAFGSASMPARADSPFDSHQLAVAVCAATAPTDTGCVARVEGALNGTPVGEPTATPDANPSPTPVAGPRTMPALHTPVEETNPTGAMKVAQGPYTKFTPVVGHWYHLNLACEDCKAGEELNFVFQAKVDTSVMIDGTAWDYGDRQPTVNDELCDLPRDFWPTEWPEGFPNLGDLVVVCAA